MKSLAVIIGRAGSKGVPCKNWVIIGGKPCVYWTVQHALAAKTVRDIVVSTDAPAVTKVAREMGTPYIDRPADLASDTASVRDVVRHACDRMAGDPVVVLYANVPIRPAGLIDMAVTHLLELGCSSVQSYVKAGKAHPDWAVTLKGTRVEPLVQAAPDRRQALRQLYLPDGGVLVVTRAALYSDDWLGDNRGAVLTEPGEVVDIDTEADLKVARALLCISETG